MKYLSEEQNKCFVGTGELNKAGDSLAVFLDKYDPDKYQNPCCLLYTSPSPRDA